MNTNDDLFANSSVYELKDNDFNLQRQGAPKVKGDVFEGNDGYILFYAPWCHFCQGKVPFWTAFAKQVNNNSAEKFRIGAVNTMDSNASKITNALQIESFPQFFHVDNVGNLSQYNGDHSPEAILGEVCDKKNKLCKIKKTTY